MRDRAIIKAINGPVVTSSAADFFVSETVRVGREGLLGEVIAVLPVGDGSVHEMEDLITAGSGHALLLSEDSEFRSE